MVCMKIEEGRAMPVSSKNFAAGMILPRATPARSGTRHSISVTRRAAAQALASARLVTGADWGAGSFFFLGMAWLGLGPEEGGVRGDAKGANGGALGGVGGLLAW